MEIVGWKGKASVRSYVPKNDRIHYLRLIGGDTSKYEVNKFEVKREITLNENVTGASKEDEIVDNCSIKPATEQANGSLKVTEVLKT